MNYSVSDCFMAAFFLGLGFGAVYEVFRIIRLIFRRRTVTFLCDAAFLICSAVGVTQLSLLLGNYVRYYTVLGFFAGVFCYINTLGRLVNGIEMGFAILIRKTVGRLAKFLARKLRCSVRVFAQFVKSIFGTIYDFFANGAKSIKRHLISRRSMVYNNSYREKSSYAQRENIQGSEKRNVIHAKVTRSTDKKAANGSA